MKPGFRKKPETNTLGLVFLGTLVGSQIPWDAQKEKQKEKEKWKQEQKRRRSRSPQKQGGDNRMNNRSENWKKGKRCPADLQVNGFGAAKSQGRGCEVCLVFLVCLAGPANVKGRGSLTARL